MSKINDALGNAPASLLEIQELTKRLDSLEHAVRDLTDIVKNDLKETKAKQEELEAKVESLEKFKNMLYGAIVLSNVLVVLIMKFLKL
jgi:predicted  nucleic acid-binding Zn-ribbon protein